MIDLLVVLGETASGKSALGLKLAQQFDGEIIAADAWTVYRGFDIGTAKPTFDEQALVPHHMLNIADPVEGFSAAVFKRLVTPIIADIQARGKLPILVGGSGLYIDSVLYDYSFLDKPPVKLRAELNGLTIPELLAVANQKALDLTKIDVRNKRRIIRLIENNGEMPTRAEIRPGVLIIGTKPPREELQGRIEKRVDTMLEQGLEQEVSTLASRYGWEAEAMKGIGYREFCDYINGTKSLVETRARIISGTAQLAKKQRTWFNRNKSIHWFTTPVNYTSIVDLVTTSLNSIE
jgi:tRNA dimethylallyltransferase